MKPRLHSEDVECFLKAYCCPLHRADEHSLLQCDVLLRYFNISLKDGVDLPKPLKCNHQPVQLHPHLPLWHHQLNLLVT
eukprot:6435739-Ditylum_brightwellii.AAC.1